MSAPRAVACFVTPHGFGHASRACAVLAALRERVPGLEVHLFTTVPRWFLRDSLGPDFSLHRLESDVGLVQRGPLAVDLPATVARLRAIYPPRSALLGRLARSLRRAGCRLALCDISPLGQRVMDVCHYPDEHRRPRLTPAVSCVTPWRGPCAFCTGRDGMDGRFHGHFRPLKSSRPVQKFPALRWRPSSWPSWLAPTISVTTPIARRVS